MPSEADSLRRTLRQVGLSPRAIEAVWPEWWSNDAEQSISAVTELRYTVARRLGLSPASLIDGRPSFVWRDEAKFKGLAASDDEQAILTSFGAALGGSLTAALANQALPSELSASDLRDALLASARWVDLQGLLSFCWAIGLPVVHVHVLPLPQKRMHAMSVRAGSRYAILLGRVSTFPAQAAYTLAHELGHILLGHVARTTALVDFEDPLLAEDSDTEEDSADAFALTVLTGSPQPTVSADISRYSGAQLAEAALRIGPSAAIDPAILALCLGHATGRWKQTMLALKLMYRTPIDVANIINSIASRELEWERLPADTDRYIKRVLDAANA